jgi:hypothetical protein
MSIGNNPLRDGQASFIFKHYPEHGIMVAEQKQTANRLRTVNLSALLGDEVDDKNECG